MDTYSENSGYPIKKSVYNFMQADDLLSKVVFFIMVIILFFLCFQLGINLIMYMFSSKRSIYLIDGMKNANSLVVVHQSPHCNRIKLLHALLMNVMVLNSHGQSG